MDLWWAYADANFGIPEKCFCGRQMKLESSTGEEIETPDRKYYTRPDWFKEASGEHIWKWWDEGVIEQFSIVQRKLEEQREKLLRLDRLQAFDPTIGEIKEEVRLLQGEVSRLKEQNANQGRITLGMI
ncbi:uncharacterized protein At4g04775-like isoform X2 [Eutrema salsugineum]|uniref:uncharacterized protein At4g04775-like isoform X2 n=1 Tax=Eutrema salsugineum TaxID=72664 RepID=UPI000CED7525|nr:uncharacterized protein At4g04775-like isoform X2 [Eutrema salsugineum]